MRIVWISLCASLIITLVDAQRNFNLSKPMVSLEKQPRTPTWQRPPEERRKLSIFPRNNKKFVVTPNTVPKTEEKAQGSSIKRSVIRKFVVQDNSEKGAWYFAPRKPLMKTKRFIVNDASQKLNEMRGKSNSNNEPFAEKVVESKKMNTSVNHINNEQINKVQINKGNLINVWRNKKANLTTLKDLKPVVKVQEQKFNNSVSNNDSKKDDYSVSSDSKTNMTIVDVTQINHELEDDKRSTDVIQSSSPLRIKNTLTETVEERSSDFNEMELIDNVNDKTNDSFNLDELQEFIASIMNDTENFSVVTPVHDVIRISNNTIINNSAEDEPHELDMSPNNFYEVKSLDNVEGYLDGSIIEVSQSLGSVNANAFSEIEHSNIKDHLNETSGNALIIDDLDRIEYIESNFNTYNKPEDVISSKPQVPIEQDLDQDIVEDFTGDPLTITTDVKTSTYEPMIHDEDLNNGLQTESPSELVFDKVGNSNTEEGIAKIDIISDTQNSEEIHESPIDESISQISDDLMHQQADISDELSQEVIIDNLNNVTSEEIYEPSIDRSNNFTGSVTGEEVSSEFMTDNLNNLTTEEISNESNMAGEEVSNEYLTFDEWLVDKSNKDVSDKSNIESENIGAEEISTEALVNRYKRGNHIIEEENQATAITSFKYTGQPSRLSQDLSFKNINA